MFNITSHFEEEKTGTFNIYLSLKNPVTLFIAIISIIVIVGTIIIAVKKGIWLSTRMYMTVMGIVDLLALVFFIALTIDKHVIALNLLRLDIVSCWFMVKVILAEILNGLIFSSNWISVLLGFERYIAVCYPLYARRIDYIHRKTAVIVILTTILIIKLPCIIMKIILKKFPSLEIEDNVYYQTYMKIELWIITLFLFLLVPFVLLALINVQLILAVRRSSRFLRQCSNQNSIHQHSNTNHEEQKITFVLIGIIVIFFVFQGPYVIYVTLYSFNVHFVFLRGISAVFLSLKSVIHFFLYCWFCDPFKQVFMQFFCRRRIQAISLFSTAEESTQSMGLRNTKPLTA